MKNVFLLITIFLFACEGGKNTKYIPKSSGSINTITAVMSSNQWKGDLGELIRENFSEEYKGLPQQEPVFNVNFIPLRAFSGFARENRNIILIQKDSISASSFKRNLYASPQLLFKISGKNISEISYNFLSQKKEMLLLFKNQELIEKTRRIKLSLMNTSKLRKALSIDLQIPSIYNVFTVSPNQKSIWIQKETKKGSMNIIVRELNNFDELNQYNLDKVISIRDSVGAMFVPGRNLNSHMITEKAYEPYISKAKLNGFESVETRGTWELTKDFMAGPFINYIIRDTINKRNLFIDGFVFSPSSLKREMIFELEAIFKSLKIYNKQNK